MDIVKNLRRKPFRYCQILKTEAEFEFSAERLP